jgi:iron complex transport system substrate-binding protein
VELLVAKDPYLIILPPMWGSTFEQTKEAFVNHASYRDLTAVKENRIITIESNLMERQGPRSAMAVRQLADAISAIVR